MIDQATELRKLSFNHTYHVTGKSRAAQLLAISSGKGGVGTTTIAVNLAVALAAKDHKVLLIETAPHRTDIETLCGLPGDQVSVTNETRRTDLCPIVQPGPAGLMILPASGGYLDQPTRRSTSPQSPMPKYLRQLQSDYDLMIADIGNQATSLSAHLYAAAHQLVMVTTCDPICIMDSFTLLKTTPHRPRVHTVVNYANSAQEANNIHQRISHACRRFLGFSSKTLGSISKEPLIQDAAAQATPFVTYAPQSQAAKTLTRMAHQLHEGRHRKHEPEHVKQFF